MAALELLLSHARRHCITRAPLSEVPLISLFIVFIIIRTRSSRSSESVPILSTVAAAIALMAVEAARVQLGQHGEPLDVGTGRHTTRVQDAPSISPASCPTRAASLPKGEQSRGSSTSCLLLASATWTWPPWRREARSSADGARGRAKTATCTGCQLYPGVMESVAAAAERWWGELQPGGASWWGRWVSGPAHASIGLGLVFRAKPKLVIHLAPLVCP